MSTSQSISCLALDVVTVFCEIWNITFNTAETKYITFKNNDIVNKIDMFVTPGNILENVAGFVYQGLKIG